MNENEIVDMYRNQNKSTYEIAKKFDTILIKFVVSLLRMDAR